MNSRRGSTRESGGKTQGDGWSSRLSPLARAEASELTAAEARLAKVLSTRYPEAALLSARGLAAEAGTSPASVSRFARKLGYSDYAELQSELAVAIRARLSSPPRRLDVDGVARRRSVGDILRDVIARDRDNLDATLSLVDESELEQLARRLSDFRSARVFVAGSKKGGVVASYFAMQLAQLRPGIVLLSLGDGLADQVLDLSGDDLLILFEPRRATVGLMRLFEVARALGTTVATFTDEHPPAALDASEYLFRTRVDAVSIFDSYAAMFALCDAVLAFVVQHSPKSVRTRAERLEDLNASFSSFYGRSTPRAQNEGD